MFGYNNIWAKKIRKRITSSCDPLLSISSSRARLFDRLITSFTFKDENANSNIQGNRSGSELRTPSDVTKYYLVEFNLL